MKKNDYFCALFYGDRSVCIKTIETELIFDIKKIDRPNFIMKQILFPLATLLLLTFSACTTKQDGILVSIDKTEALVGEALTITVMQGNDDVTDFSTITYAINGIAKELKGNVFVPKTVGVYEIRAEYNNTMSDVVSVTVESDNEFHGKAFYRRNLIYKITGTWCVYCPQMAYAIQAIQKAEPDRYVDVSLHLSDLLTTNAGFELITHYNPVGVPAAYVDNASTQISQDKDLLVYYSNSSVKRNPTISGLKLTTSIDADKQITVDVETSVNKTAEFSLAVALLVNGFTHPQTGYGGSSPEQNHVLYDFLNEGGFEGENIGYLTADEDNTDVRTFTYDFSDYNEFVQIDKLEIPSNLTYTIVAIIMNKNKENEWLVNNVVSCELGENTEFKYAE